MKLREWRLCQEIPVIYGILNLETNKWYIGSCHSMKDRMRRHYYNVTHNMHHSAKFQRSWNKYGEDAFDVRILFDLTNHIDDRFDIEESYIKKYDSKNNGYNILDICNYTQCFHLSKEAAEKAGKTHSLPVIAIDRFTNKIVKEYDSITHAAADIKESTSNISQVCKGKLRYVKDLVFVYKNEYDKSKDYTVLTHHMKNVPKSEEWKKKVRTSNKRSKIIYKYDLNNNLICKYSSRRYAEQCEGFKCEYLRRRLNIPLNGFIFTDKEIKDIV